MDIEQLRAICRGFTGVEEDVKWGQDLCMTIGGKMFLVMGLEEVPCSASFKASDADFESLTAREGFIPAPYLARHRWVHVDNLDRLPAAQWQALARQAYELVAAKLPLKTRKALGLA